MTNVKRRVFAHSVFNCSSLHRAITIQFKCTHQVFYNV